MSTAQNTVNFKYNKLIFHWQEGHHCFSTPNLLLLSKCSNLFLFTGSVCLLLSIMNKIWVSNHCILFLFRFHTASQLFGCWISWCKVIQVEDCTLCRREKDFAFGESSDEWQHACGWGKRPQAITCVMSSLLWFYTLIASYRAEGIALRSALEHLLGTLSRDPGPPPLSLAISFRYSGWDTEIFSSQLRNIISSVCS